MRKFEIDQLHFVRFITTFTLWDILAIENGIRGYHCRYPLPSQFGKNKGGYLYRICFIKDFLSKKYSGAKRQKNKISKFENVAKT